MKSLPFLPYLLCLSMLITLMHSGNSFGQSLSTEGKDFWVGYLDNWLQNTNNPVILELYVSADDTTHGVVSIPGQAAFTPVSFEVYPNLTKKIQIPTSLGMATSSGQIENKGIHIETDKNVSVYAMNKRQYSADMSVIIPTYSLGNNYYVLSHWEDGNRNNNDNSDAELLIVAITDQTEIEISPTVATINGNPANVPFRITLQKGQTYQLKAKGDLTGTQIAATDLNGCQNFAVFSGNMYTQVGECGVTNGHDHIYAQMYPTNTLGREFIVMPLENRTGGDIIKILATENDTHIAANGHTYVLDKGKFVKFLSASVLQIKSDKPIAVGQYSRTMGCDDTLGDPFLIPISPNEQLLQKITFNAPSIATLSRYSLNIITRQDDISNITFDGQFIGHSFISLPGSDYAYTRINTIGGNHTIKAEGGFIAYVYGFGQNESFGYATGASLGNLNIDFAVNDQNTETPIDSLCLGSDISFTPTADTLFTSFEYDFGDGHFFTTDRDSTVTHKYNKVGEYLVSLRASTGRNDCSSGNEEVSRKIIRIIEPNTSILGPRSVCPNTSNVSYVLEDDFPNTYQWFVKGGSFVHQENKSAQIDWGITNSGSKIQLLATNQFTCVSDTIVYPVKVNIQLDPEAPFGEDTLCSNNMISIPYSTYFTNGSIYQWASDFGQISKGNGTNEIEMDWNGHGIGKLWFNQQSVTDTICDGVSDTLLVYIQRNPSESGAILVQKDTFMLGEAMQLGLAVDDLYRFANWSLGDGTTLDTMDVGQPISYIFQCPGIYMLSAVAYDTGTICSETRANMMKKIVVIPPNIDMLIVTKSQSNSKALDIYWDLTQHDYYTKNLFLYRRKTGLEDWQLIATLSPQQLGFTDENVEIDQFSYEYRLETNKDCEEVLATTAHRSILLITEKIDSLAQLHWNNYLDWPNGVDQYEIWANIDSGGFELVEQTSDLYLTYSDQDAGFEHCFEIRAREKDGRHSVSVSNASCVSFIPQITTYNIFTPNTDKINEHFVVKNIHHYPKSKLAIWNRWGKVIYEKTGYKNDWDGKINGKKSAPGTYYFELKLNEPRNKIRTVKGYFSILY